MHNRRGKAQAAVERVTAHFETFMAAVVLIVILCMFAYAEAAASTRPAEIQRIDCGCNQEGCVVPCQTDPKNPDVGCCGGRCSCLTCGGDHDHN